MKITIPNSWGGVTLGEYQAVTKQLKEAEKRLKDLEGREKATFQHNVECALISTLSGVSIDDIMGLTVDSHNRLMNELGFLSQPIEGKVKTKARVNGKRYYFEKHGKKINGGQWITLMHFLDDEENIEQNLHNLLACFAYRVKWFKREYSGDNHEDVANDMLKLPITFVKPLTDFFLLDYLNSVGRTMRYSVFLLKGMKRLEELKQKRSLLSTGG